MLRVFQSLLITSLFLAGVAHGDTPTLSEVRSAMDTAWKDMQSLSADVNMDFLFPVGTKTLSLSGVGTFHYLREDGKDKSRQRITTKIPEPFPMEMNVDILFDGKKMHTTIEMMGQKQTQVGEPSLEQGALPPGGPRLIKALEKHLNLSVKPTESLDGHEVYVLDGIPKDKTAPIAKIRIYIDQKMAVQRKTEIFQPDGTIGITVLFTNLKQDTSPDPNLFVPSK